MRLQQKIGLLLFSLLVAGLYWLYPNQESTPPDTRPSALAKTIDACDWIAEKAAMPLPETLPFQRLEKVARRMRVFESCMQDRGFKENPAWVAYAEPLVKQAAAQQSISINEAYELMRRDDMIRRQVDKAPSYWIVGSSQ